MKNTDLMIKTDLKMTAIVVEAVVPARDSPAPPEAGWGHPEGKITFIVDTETWECQGQAKGPTPLMVDEDWWAEQCQKVSDRVRAQIKSTAP